MFGRKKVDPPKRTEGGKALMAQMGFMTNIDDMVLGSPGNNDEDLEAELRALQGIDGSSSKHKKVKLKSSAELEKMITMSMQDIASDEDVSDSEDPELIAELEGLMSDDEDIAQSPSATVASLPSLSSSSVMHLLQERIGNYSSAIINSKISGDSSKVRRYERGLRTLEDLLEQAKMNKPIPEADIPPPVTMPTRPLQNSTPQKLTPTGTSIIVGQQEVSPIPPSQMDLSNRSILRPPQTPPKTAKEDHPNVTPISPQKDQIILKSADKLMKLMEERDLFKSEALTMKRIGNNDRAIELLKVSKQFDAAIKAAEEGQSFDEGILPSFSKYPPSPGGTCSVPVNVATDSKQGASSPTSSLVIEGRNSAETLLDALLVRMNKYKEAEQQANSENNSSKARRMGRIVRQYEDAIKMHKKGLPYDLAELPSPPGFQPLQAVVPSSVPSEPLSAQHQNHDKPKPPVPLKTSPKPPQVQRQVSHAHSRAEQQASFLEHRQLQFKKAAMQAKVSSDLELAKKYMRMAKGFDQMIEASRSGLPVDLSQIPKPPGEESDFVFVYSSDVPSEVSGDTKEVYKRLQDDLINHIKLSEANRDMFTKLGDISSANKFEKLRENTTRDLESLKNAFEHGDPVPRFHYETRQFSIVRCCPDLGDNDLEVSIIRGLNFNSPAGYNPSDMHTYVKFEFPFPDSPQVGETSVVKGTDSPEFNFTTKLEVKRNSRSFLRLLKSNKTFKFDVYYKRGFLKGDKVLGSASIKLLPLEDKCVYHESLDLMEGRKTVGGKLEVKIRIRDPFVNKQVDETREKWLVIDDFIRKPLPSLHSDQAHAMSSSPAQRGDPSPSTLNPCISVLMYEKDVLDQQVVKYQNKLKPVEVAALKQKGVLLQKTANNLRSQLQTGGTKGMQDYLSRLKVTSQAYAAEVKKHALHNASDKIKTILTKKTLVDKEIESISKKLQGR